MYQHLITYLLKVTYLPPELQGLYGTVFVVGLLGNTLVIYVVLRYTKMQTVTNLYILNLAVADECFLIGIPFIMTTMGLGYWPFGNVMCKVRWPDDETDIFLKNPHHSLVVVDLHDNNISQPIYQLVAADGNERRSLHRRLPSDQFANLPDYHHR